MSEDTSQLPSTSSCTRTPDGCQAPAWMEVEKVVRQARSASAPESNSIPYRLYENVSEVLKCLWKLMRVAWWKGMIPKAWTRAGGILIPKEKDSSAIGQFCQISLLNVERFPSVFWPNGSLHTLHTSKETNSLLIINNSELKKHPEKLVKMMKMPAAVHPHFGVLCVLW